MNSWENFVSGYSIFASANGYNGFYSLFSEIFCSKNYDRIYVLKGGPGTGKSTLMKKIRDFFKNDNCKSISVLCSSDPNSLDGIIISSKNAQIAILDGTAPHERDAIIPGAIDEIVNLGEGFDNFKLKSQRDEIISLGEIKSAAYKKGYEYLEICGKIDDSIKKFCYKYADYSRAEMDILNSIMFSEIPDFKKPNHHFVSSFSKYGYAKIANLENAFSKIIKIGGDFDLALCLLTSLAKNPTLNKKISVLCPYPLCPDFSELIIVGETAIIAVDSNNCDFNALNYLKLNIIPEEINLLKECRNILMGIAINAFSDASYAHFELEKIYTNAVDFENNNKILERIIIEINNIIR